MYSFYIRPDCNITPGHLPRQTLLRHLQAQAPSGSALVDQLTLSQAPTVDGAVQDLSKARQACNQRMETRVNAGKALKILGVVGGVAAACLLPLGAAVAAVGLAVGAFAVGHRMPRGEAQTRDAEEWNIANDHIKQVSHNAGLLYDRAVYFEANADGSHSPYFRGPDGLTTDPKNSAWRWRA